MKYIIFAVAGMCAVGAVCFGLTLMDAYGDWTNLNCAKEPACWSTDWREVALDAGATIGSMAGAIALFLSALNAR